MKIVDTHCHTGIHKYEPVESLLYHMDTCDVDQAVLIQHAGETDNAHHVQCMERFPGRFAAAMIVAPDDDGRQIRRWAERGVVGIRLPANSRAQCADPLFPVAHSSRAQPSLSARPARQVHCSVRRSPK